MSKTEVTTTEVAEWMGLSMSKTWDVLVGLVRRGFIEKLGTEYCSTRKRTVTWWGFVS